MLGKLAAGEVVTVTWIDRLARSRVGRMQSAVFAWMPRPDRLIVRLPV
jgi:hypothetical protein